MNQRKRKIGPTAEIEFINLRRQRHHSQIISCLQSETEGGGKSKKAKAAMLGQQAQLAFSDFVAKNYCCPAFFLVMGLRFPALNLEEYSIISSVDRR